MNCPHCTQPIADALVASAAASISASKRKRPGGPAGTPTACPKCHEVFGSERAARLRRDNGSLRTAEVFDDCADMLKDLLEEHGL